MKQLDARKDSNAARPGGDTAERKEPAEIAGYTLVAYPTSGPAEENSDVKSNGDSIGAKEMGDNLGTSRSSYKEQPEGNPAESSGNVK